MAALFLLRADMYQDGSNAVQPAAINNLGKAAGSYFAPAFGACTWDAAHDVGPCLNAALAAVAAAGGGVVAMPPGVYGLGTKVVWPTTGGPVGIRCPLGNASYTNVFPGGGTQRPATTLKWIGVDAGRMMELKTLTGAIRGAQIKYCAFDGNDGKAADGLYLASVANSHFDDLTFVGGFSGGNIVHLTVEGPEPAWGSQDNTFHHLFIDNGTAWGPAAPYTSNQLRLGAYIDATTGVHGNAAMSRGDNIWLSGSGSSVGILCVGCDNNYFSGRIFSDVNTRTAIDLSVAIAGTKMYPANGNEFKKIFYYGNLIARGKTTFPTCVSPTAGTPPTTCTYANEVLIDATNPTSQPTIEPGAQLSWASNDGFVSGLSLVGKQGARPGFVAAQDYSIWPTCVGNALASGTFATAYLCDSSAQFIVFDGIAGDRFHITQNGTAGAKNLVFDRAAGTGHFQFAQNVQLDQGISVTIGGGAPLLSVGADLITRAKYLAPETLTPVNGTNGCAAGMITSDASYVYVCTATNTWKRAALTAY